MKASVIHGTWLLVTCAAAGASWYAAQQNPSSAGGPGGKSTRNEGAATVRDALKANPISGEAGVKPASSADDPDKWVSKWMKNGAMSAEGMEEAVMDAMRESDPVKGMANFARLLRELTPENAEAALKSIRAHGSGFDQMRFAGLLAHAWGGKDGAGAMAAADKSGGRDGGMLRMVALSGWAAADPEGAQAWLTEYQKKEAAENAQNEGEGRGGRGGRGGPGGGMDGMLVRGLVSGLAAKDFNGAMEYVKGLTDEQRGEFTSVLAEQKLKEGTESASAWALSLTDPNMKRSALEAVSRQYARQGPEAAAAWAASIAGQDGSQRAVSEVAGQYANSDPAKAQQWAATLPQGESRNEAYQQVFSQWARADAVAAATALNTMTAGADKDSALQSFSRSVARENPQDAIAYASTISDAQAREAAQVQVAQRWRQQDQAAADAWIQQNLSAEAQQKAATEPDWRRDFGGGGGPPGGFGGGGRGGRGR